MNGMRQIPDCAKNMTYGDDAVKDDTVVIATPCQLCKVFAGLDARPDSLTLYDACETD